MLQEIHGTKGLITGKENFMAGYIWHVAHAYETYSALSEETRRKMPINALRKFIIGAIAPDFVDDKNKTHFYKEHPEYGKSYKYPDMDVAEMLFLTQNPIELGVLAHLKYDKDHVNNFLLVYARPCQSCSGDMEYENTKTGRKISEKNLFGDKAQIYGELYKLYDKFNEDMAEILMPKLNKEFGTEFENNKTGFIEIINWLCPFKWPMTGIEIIDKNRKHDSIGKRLQEYFKNDGQDCKLEANFDNLEKIIKSSAQELAKQIDDTYSEVEKKKMFFVEGLKKMCKKYDSVKLFVDMDGTIAEYPVYDSNEVESKMEALYSSTRPLIPIIERLELVSKIPNLKIYILSLSKNEEITAKKQEWLQKYTPFIPENQWLILTRNKDYTSENRDTIKGESIIDQKEAGDFLILLDDDHKVLRSAKKMLGDDGAVYHVSSVLV